LNQKTIVEDFKDQIISGELQPGQRLQGRGVYERHYNTTTNTVQRAFNILTDDGYVKSFSRKGTFVSDPPPHLKNIALLIYSPDIPDGWGEGNNYWRTLERVCFDLSQQTGRNIHIRTAIAPELNGPEYQELLADVQARRLGGLILCMGPSLLAGTPILGTEGLPVVSLMEEQAPRIPRVISNGQHFYELAFEQLFDRGRRRIAVICPPTVHGNMAAIIDRVSCRAEVTVKDTWLQVAAQKHPGSVSHLVQLLLSAPCGERPDGLILTDDNFVDYACMGLSQSGVQLGRDIDVVAQANFPLAKPDMLPLIRVGWNQHHCLSVAIEKIDRMRQSNGSVQDSVIPASLGSFGMDMASAVPGMG
jgi:DNA-binding LacI/PurR family transcriptional regulator